MDAGGPSPSPSAGGVRRRARAISLRAGADLDGFRAAAAPARAGASRPERVVWSIGEAPGLFGRPPEADADAPPVGPAARGGRADRAAWCCHRDPERYALLYALIWRVLHGERQLLEVASDPLVHRLERMAQGDRAATCTRCTPSCASAGSRATSRERFVAWFEPDHHILEATAPFFVDRFRALRLDDPDAGRLRCTGTATTLDLRPAGRREDAPAQRRLRGRLARLLREHLQSGAHQPQRDAGGDAEEVLAQHARDRRDPGPRPAGRGPHRADDREGAAMPVKRDPARAVAAMADQDPDRWRR